MNKVSSSGESRPRELQWDRAALAKVFGYLDATTLVNVQLASKSFREIVKNDSVWESSFRNDFPYYAQRVTSRKQRRNKQVAWYSEYMDRAHREYCWRTGKLSKEAVVLTGHAGTIRLLEGDQDVVAVRGTTPSKVANSLEDRSTSVQVDTKEEVTKSGILSLYQLYGTPQIACTTFESGVHIVRAREVVREESMDERPSSSSGKREREEDEDCLQRAFSVKNDVNPGGSTYSFHPVLECLGQEAPCAKTFVDKNSRILAIPSLDGAVRLYSLPEWITNCSLHVEEDGEEANQGKEPTLSPSAELYDDVELLVTENNTTSRVKRKPVCALTMSEACDVMVTGGNDMRVKVWDMHHNIITSRMEGHSGWIWNVKPLDPFLNVAMSTSTDGFCRKWDRRTGTSVDRLMSQHMAQGIFIQSPVSPCVAMDGTWRWVRWTNQYMSSIVE
eukprot:jgi/Picre1/33714/NNA_001193.t1